MGTKLYVGGLSYSTTTEELQGAFSRVGQVQSATIITDKMTGRSRGFGFVEMSTQEEANAAISQLNGQSLGDRTITVNEARPQAPRSGGGGDFRGGNRGGGGRSGQRW